MANDSVEDQNDQGGTSGSPAIFDALNHAWDHGESIKGAFPSLTLDLPQIPRIDLPVLVVPAAAELSEAVRRWQAAIAPLTKIGDELRDRYAEIMKPFAGLSEPLRRLQVIDAQCGRLEALGWLPHANSPLDLIADDPKDPAAVNAAIHQHYAIHWPDIARALCADIDASALDDEAKATFAEAVAAHGAGLYRCAPRLLFPEIERVSRKEIHGGALDKMASQQRLMEAIGGLTPAEMSSTGVAGLRFYKKLTRHLYMHMKDEAAVGIALADPVPNRHASLHGIVSYSSPQSSINAILAADYLLRAISTIKQLAAEDAAAAHAHAVASS
ncbi:MAG: hypothetical protein V4472_24280 [Pseudomonadota bacterium]